MMFSLSSFAASNRHHHIPFRFEVHGVSDDTIQKNITDTLKNYRNHFHFPIQPKERQHFLLKAPKYIAKAIAPYGYFNSHIQSALIKTSKAWVAEFNVSLGPPLRITTMQIEITGQGKDDPEFIKWKKRLPLHIGQRLQTKTYEDVKTKLDDIAISRGYFQAKMIKTQIQINLTRYESNIIIIYDTGPRFRFGKTTFSKSPFYDKFLQKFLTYHEGEYYSAEKLETTQAGLLRGNYFEQVRIFPEIKKAANGTVPIKVNLILLKAKTFILGLGYGTDTSIRGTAGATLRYIGHSGERFQALGRASPQNSSFIAKYMIPGFNPANDLLTIGAGASYINQVTGNANNGQFGVTYITTRGEWKTSLSLSYLNETYNLSNLPITQTQLVYPTIGIKYLHTNNPLNPKRGISFKIQFAGADQSLLSETSFTQFTAHLRTLYTIEETHTRVLVRADAGRTDIANLNNLPLSLQLFAGGAQSVRGYAYDAIGPGRNLAVASYEMQQRIIGGFYVAGFVDAGNVVDGDVFQNMHVGAGPGVAWISSIGTMELTTACAVLQSNHPWTIQFIMGTAL